MKKVIALVTGAVVLLGELVYLAVFVARCVAFI
jgi:hypothetical protein